MRRTRGLAAVIALAWLAAACTVGGMNVLGGRERCWPEGEQRLTTLWKGTLEIDATGARLVAPEGDVFTIRVGNGGAIRTDLAPPAIADADGGVMAEHGDLITVFGGLGGDGTMVVCGVEERTAG